MGSRSWANAVGRVLRASVPFVVIVAVFAAAVAWHLAAPGRQVAAFHRLIADDAPVERDYGDTALVTMQRLGCRGSCPSYSVRIHGSGEIEFEGSAFVCVKHPLGDRVLRVTAQRLIDAMSRVGFDQLHRPQRPMIPNAAITVTSLQVGGATHGVEDDGGRDVPPIVAEIERQVDRVAGTARWRRIPRNDGAHVPFCPGPDGTKKVFDATGQLVPEASAASTAAPDAAARFEAILAGTQPSPVAFPDDAFVEQRRTACYGACPIYAVRVFGSGRVEFKGERFVCDTAPPASHIDRAAAQRLLGALAGAGFASLPDFTRVDRTDAPTVAIELSGGAGPNGGVHKISHYLGMRDVPPQLDAFEHAIDRVSGAARWLPAQADGACRRADGTRDRFTRGGAFEPVAASAAGR